MGSFSKIFKHIESKDLRNKHEQKKVAKIQEEKKEEEFKQYLVSTMEKKRYSWREGMTTSDVSTISVEKAPGDGTVTPVDAIDAASYAANVVPFNDGVGRDGNTGTEIRDSGSGSGSNGGFNVGGKYLAFQGTGYNDTGHNMRWAGLSAIDATQVDTLEIMAIVGNDSNGGEDPDATLEDLRVMYKTPAMNQFRFLFVDPDGSVSSRPTDSEVIIPLGASSKSGLNKYSVEIPEVAREKDTEFLLMQGVSSGTGFDNYGITEIKFQRRTPLTVVVPLDDPEASSFIRGAEQGSTPKKRKKDVNDKLEASDEYTLAKFGNEFPGQEVRVGGEDPFKGAEIGDDVKPSPQGKDEVKKSFADFQKGDQRVEVIKTPEQIKAQNDEYLVDLDNLLTRNEYNFTDPKVLEISDKILESDPKNIDAYFYKSAYYDMNGEPEKAVEVIDQLIENNPDDPDGYTVRSYYRREAGDLAGAIEDVEKTIELDPESEFIAYYEMELADLKFQEAEVETDNAVRDRMESEAGAIEAKAHQDYWSNAEDLMPENNLTEEQEQQISSNLAQAKDLFSTTNYRFGRGGWNTKGAISLLQEILPLDPNNTEILSNLGVAMIMGGSKTEGQQYLEKAKSLDPNVKFDFGIKSWDRYDGEETQPYAGARIDKLSYMPHRYAREIIENLPDQSTAEGAKYGALRSDYKSSSKYYTDQAKGKSTRLLQSMLVSAAREIEDNKYWMEDLSRHPTFSGNTDVVGVPGYVLGGTKWTGALNGVTQEDWLRENEIMDNWPTDNAGYYKDGWREQWEKTRDTLIKYQADSRSKLISGGVKNDIEKYQAYYDEYMKREVGELPELPEDDTPTPTLYDWMQTTYDDEEINQEIQEQGFEKQYKDLMTAWDSADKFSKFITPLKNLSDALLGSKTAQNAKYENYKIAIAKSIMLNKPIRVNPDTIDPMLIKKLGDRITPNQILDYDEEQRYNAVQEKYVKSSKAAGNYNPSLVYDYEVERMMSGEPVIPIVSEAVPYADENIYEDEFGRVFTNDGSVANTTFQPDKGYHGFAQGYVTDIMGKNPIAGRGQAQYQIVVPPDGTEPYLLYKDHAYHNVKSDDTGETPGFMNQGAAGFVNWLGNTAHARGDGDANTGGMAGYPPNIRGDVITEFRINLTDLPEDVQGAVYRHPLMTEQPELVQALKDTIYTDKNVKKMAGSKDLHNLYMLAVKGGDKLKDFVVDNGVEILMGLNPDSKFDMTSASNMLQFYDDYIQKTVHTPDGKTYVPGYTTPDGGVVNRLDVTEQFTSRQQNHLENLMNDRSMQVLLKQYLDGGSSKSQLQMYLDAHLSDISNAGSAAYDPVLANSLGKGTRINLDEFLNGKIIIEKNYEFRPLQKDKTNWIVDSVAMMFDVSNDTVAAGNILLSMATMTAARQLLHPVRGPGILPGLKQSFAQAMNTAPTMPYKLEFNFSEKMRNILLGIEDEDKPKDGSDLGSAGEIGGVDATAAATAAAERRKKKNNKGKVNESNLYERLKKRPFFNQDDIKPEFPENPPPKLDPKTGMHPQYGKKAGRYKKLDPISANSMPTTGDPEIDAVVNKQKTINKIKKMARNK